MQALAYLWAFPSDLLFCLVSHLLWKFPFSVAQPVGFPLSLLGRAHPRVYVGALSLAPSGLGFFMKPTTIRPTLGRPRGPHSPVRFTFPAPSSHLFSALVMGQGQEDGGQGRTQAERTYRVIWVRLELQFGTVPRVSAVYGRYILSLSWTLSDCSPRSDSLLRPLGCALEAVLSPWSSC